MALTPDPSEPNRRRPATVRRDSNQRLIPGEVNHLGQPMGTSHQHNQPMSKPHDWSAFEKAFPTLPNGQPRPKGVGPAEPSPAPTPNPIAEAPSATSLSPLNPNQKGVARDSGEFMGPTAGVTPFVNERANEILRTGRISPPAAPAAPKPQHNTNLMTPDQWRQRFPGIGPSGGTVTNTGTSPFNHRGERLVDAPGSVTNGPGGIIREVDPRRDHTQTFLNPDGTMTTPATGDRRIPVPGGSPLPKGATGGMVIDPRYVVPGASNIATVSRGTGAPSRTGRIFDETGDVTGDIMDRVRAGMARAEHRNAKPAAPAVSREEIARTRKMFGLPEHGGPGAPLNPSLAALQGQGERTAKARGQADEFKQRMRALAGPDAATAAAPKPAARRTHNFYPHDTRVRPAGAPPTPSRPPINEWWARRNQPRELHTTGVVDALSKGLLEDANQHAKNYYTNRIRQYAATAANAMNRGSGAGSRAQQWLAKFGQGITPPQPPPQPVKKATKLAGNGSQAQVRHAAQAY